MKNPLNAQPQPLAGRRLPADWQQQAAARAALADANYARTVENAWRRPLTYGMDRLASMGIVSLTKSAQLSQQNTDSLNRSDRLDSELRLVGRDGEWEVWQDSHGATIRKRVN